MSEADSFRDLIRRVRAGEAEAAATLVRQYEPAIRLAVHVRLTDPALRRVLDSQDVCQSVLASFFLRAAAGQYEVDTPEQLLNLLATMVRNKLLNQAHHHHAARRDLRRVRPGVNLSQSMTDPRPDPSEEAAHHELVREFRKRLSAEEQDLADGRAQGRTWQELADALGGNPNTLRMRLERAVDRIARELGLEP